ncbi:beige/BEACH/WD domain containing protein [Artemisia annua]|uniref:Beige/BEACH/WD domain containing protein n=1 Tax=Artemisia annua TaxID=35608 RepID=A0A2U1PVB6_ARTAN|nr:beige/BEACH/WD domain containing protein [Artemisia annua]
MKWVSLLKDFKEKVGLTTTSSSPGANGVSTGSSPASASAASASPSPYADGGGNDTQNYFSSSSSRDRYELELDFKRYWEEFRSSSLETEKEKALNMTVDVFCRFVKQHSNVAQLITLLVEAHIFSFVVGRAFVTDIEKLRLSSRARLLEIERLIGYFSEVTEDGIQPGSNLLQAVEYLVSGPIDKQSLLDSGILCCLIHILNALLGPDGRNTRHKVISVEEDPEVMDNTGPDRRLEVEGSVVHIMKALASHPTAAQSLIEDKSLQLLFEMVANGSLILFSRYKEGLVPLHSIQLHRHAMQILGLLMANDNGSTAKYIRKHQLIKVLLIAVKDFKPETGDPAYTMSIVDLLLECIELSYRPEAGDVRLREDVRNAHGYQYLVQFALVLSKDQDFETSHSENISSEGDSSSQGLSPILARLLDVLVNLSQTGPSDAVLSGSKAKRRTRTSSSDRFSDDGWEKDNYKVKDIDAIQVLQDIFLKADSRDLQAEVLNRMFKIFSSHLENYMLCQQLRTVPLLILNMGGFPSSLQEIILKILEYAVTVVNCIPDQELLALCCLLQQHITSELKHTILAFFIKLLSFDQQYKKVLREVGVLEVLIDDLKQHKFLMGPSDDLERKSNSNSFKKHLDNKDAIISSPKLLDSSSGKFSLFEVESTVSAAWDCLFYLLKKAEQNQVTFRSASGVTTALPFLVSDIHRPGVLRVLSCLIIEDSAQVHSDELSVLVEVSKSGMVTSALGSQYELQDDAKCDVFGAIWRILGANGSAQRVFGEATGFSLLLTTLHSFQGVKENETSLSTVCMKIFTYLLRVTTAGVCNNAVNRERLNTILSSHTFYDLLSESGLICVECERQVMQLLLELALEIVLPPFSTPEKTVSSNILGNSSIAFPIVTQSGLFHPEKERIYNAGALRVLIRSLLLFTPKLQLELLKLIEELASAGPFNQENLTSAGCVELLLETIYPFLSGSSSLLSHALKIVEVLGAYRLSTAELRMIIRCLLQLRQKNAGHILVDMMERIVIMQDTTSEKVPLAPFVEMDMKKMGYASIHVSLGERSWPPAAGYSFVCWFQYRNFLKLNSKDMESSKAVFSKRNASPTGPQVLRIFSVGAVDGGDTFYAELYLQDNGTLTLATSNSSSLSFSGLDINEDQWHHLAVVHSKPNALAGLFQASVAYVYLNGKLRHTGRLGYSPSPAGKSLQVTIGTPVSRARVSDLAWTLRSCYLFEEVLTPGSIFFMYILGRGYRGLFQDTNLLQFVPNQACRGGSMAILDTLETDLSLTSINQRSESANKQGNSKTDRSGMVWDFERLGNLSLQLSGRKLIFAFDGTSTEAFPASGTLSMLNLVDPLSAAASPIGGIPRFGRLHGDVYVCKHCIIGETVRPIGGIAVVLALIQVAETSDMLQMALTLLACALNQNPQNVRDMQAFRGYHLLALFLHSRMSMFDMRSLEIFFQIAACEASFPEVKKLEEVQNNLSPSVTVNEAAFDELSLSKFGDDVSSDGSRDDMDDFSLQKDAFSHISGLDDTDTPPETSNCIVLSNADMVEHVLLDWTVWVAAEIPIQIALLGFLENLVSLHWYRNHNLTILRRINLVQHLLVTLQRGDVEVPVLEKLVVLLGVILEDGFVISELEHVVRFVIMTFDPPELSSRIQISREPMGKHVIVRNMLLEMLIDLLVTISSEELLEQWHKIVSSKLVTYFLDEGVHPTSMRWIMTLLGVCLTSSPTFALKFRTSGGYQGLMRVLPSFYDSPDIYYVLFCLIFGKPVYPRLPEVRMLDFHALMPNDGNNVELRFIELLDSVIAMAKMTFDRLSLHTQGGSGLVTELVDGSTEMAGDLQGEALMHKTYAARLMGGEASAPAATASVLRFMVDLAKMCPPFSAVCRRAEFFESCVDLYFSCIRGAHAVKMAKELSVKAEDKNTNDADDTSSSQNTFSSLPHEQEESTKTSISMGSFAPVQGSASSEDIPVVTDNMDGNKTETNIILSPLESQKSTQETEQGSFSTSALDSKQFEFHDLKITPVNVHPTGSPGSPSLSIYDSPILSERSNSRFQSIPSPSPSQILGFQSWLGGGSDMKSQSAASPSMESSLSLSEFDSTPDLKFPYQALNSTNTLSAVNPRLILDVEESGYGGGPCSIGATAILDFMAEVLADFVTDQIKATPVIESILETVPLYVDAESVLVFQGLCLTRLMNFVERRLLRDDEEDDKKLDKNRWSLNLEALCYLIVDRVYMGAFPQPAAVLKTLEFLLSMLQLANKDGRIEQALPAGKGILSIGRGTKQLDAYVHAIFKNMNRIIMYCFLPSFLISIGEDEFLSRLGLQIEPRKRIVTDNSEEDGVIDICTVLQLLVAHRRIIFCPSNLDTDLTCCLCINLISLLHDQRPNARNLAVDILKHLLVHRRAALEDLLVSKPNQGPVLDVLHGGFDLLLTGTLSTFFDWLHMSDLIVNRTLEQCAAIMWVQYVAGSVKFPGVRTKGMDSRRKKEIGRKSRDSMKLDQRHWEQVNERRIALELVRDAMSTELRVMRQDKYGWVLHAESEWQTHLQQLIHEQGIFAMPRSVSNEEPEWQLCPIEGPYRMRKKLERCKLKVDTAQTILDGKFEFEEASKEKPENNLSDSNAGSDTDPLSNLLSSNVKQESFNEELFDESIFKDSDDVQDGASIRVGWNNNNNNDRDMDSSINDESLHSAAEFSMKSSSATAPFSESIQEKSVISSPKKSSSTRFDEVRAMEDKLDKELSNNGEYLIRPYLLPAEKIKFRYNCERVVGLDKHDGIFLIGELCLYVIENFYIDESGCICEKETEDELSVIDQALGVTRDFSMSMDSQSKLTSSWGTTAKAHTGGRAWAYNGGAWGKEKVGNSGNVPHLWRMWKLNSVHEMLKRDYQLRPVAIEIFSMDGCNDLLVFHKKEREEVFKNLLAMNLPRNSMLDTTISGSVKQESAFKLMAKSFSKRWQNGEITNFQYLMHLNTLAGRGYSDLTQYPVFPWVLADYESEELDLTDEKSFRKLDKPMGCQTEEGEDEFKKRYESWDDPEIPKFHYGSHYSSAGIVLFYLLRLPPFSTENQKLQGGQFDHADRLFNSVRDTWSSAAGRGNTSDVKELIPEFFYMPEFLENRFGLDLGEKQSGEKVGDVVLPPWAKGSAREFIKKHREALESDYVSENLHHWIDLIFGYKQRGKAAEEAVNVFYHYTYEGSVDIDAVTDPAMKASILAQINHFGQTPKQLFQRAHAKRKKDKKIPINPLKYSGYLVPHEIRKSASAIAQIITSNDKILMVGPNNLLKPRTYANYVAWGFPDRSLRYMSYDQDKLLSTHENLHGGNQIQCASASHDGQLLVTGADDGLVCVWRVGSYSGSRAPRSLQLEKALSAHRAKITCLHICQPHMIIISGSDDCTVVLWDLSSLGFIRQLPEFSSPVSAIYMNELTGEIVTAAGIMLAVWSINGDCLSVVNTSQLPSDYIVSVTTCTFSDWLETNWYVSGHQSGAVKVWQMVHNSSEGVQTQIQPPSGKASTNQTCGLGLGDHVPEYTLVLRKVLRGHKHAVTALHLTSDLKQLLSGDSGGHLISWTLPDESLRNSIRKG